MLNAVCTIGRKIAMILYDALMDTIRHDGVEHAGYLSFLLMLSIFPFLFFFVATVSSFSTSFDQQIFHMLTEIIVESEWAAFIHVLQPRITEMTTAPPANFVTVAIIGALWTASSIFEALRTILNRAYRVTSPPAYVLRRLVSVIEFIIMVTLTLLVTVLLIVLPPFWEMFANLITDSFISSTSIIQLFGEGAKELRHLILISFGVVFIAYLYYFLPNIKQRIIHVLPGTFAVLLGWSGFSLLFKYYISSFPQIHLIYGSIAGIVIALLYFYACSLILIYGAELNYHIQQACPSKAPVSSMKKYRRKKSVSTPSAL